jgi:hypothetical protein
VASCARADPPTSPQHASSSNVVGLFTTLPILWAETEDLAGHLRADVPPHWVLTALRRRGEVKPIDSMMPVRKSEGGTTSPLDGLRLLVMAQPRALAPEENVALDAWVRAGGNLLLFADPMLTEESAYGLGDRRRPQDVILLSPILDHWMLRLEFDEVQPAGERNVRLGSVAMPVDLPGRIVMAPGARHCSLLADAVVADCRIGRGRLMLVADAALLAGSRVSADSEGDGATGLEWLLATVIDQSRAE